MEKYGKLFRKKSDNDIALRSYAPDNDKYFELIKKAREDGYHQLIINSELMISIIYSTLELDGILMKITMSDNTDEDIKENIEFIIKKMRHDKFLFLKLKEELEWAIDSGSIDIYKIDLYFQNERYTLYSNGIISGKNINYFFDTVLNPILGSYFDV